MIDVIIGLSLLVLSILSPAILVLSHCAVCAVFCDGRVSDE